MRFGTGKIFSRPVLLLLGCLLLTGLNLGAVSVLAAELSFTKAEGQMVFTIPYEAAPEINALFVDSGSEVALILPADGIKIKLQQHKLEDEWITAFGIERVGDHLRWYLKKRDPALKVKSFLALERQKTELKVVLLKPYRQWQPTVATDKNSAANESAMPAAGEQEKLNRLNRLLENPDSNGAAKSLIPGAGTDDKASPSLLKSAVRSFVVLIFLVLVIFGLSIWLKRYRQKGGRILGSNLVKVLSVEVISGKHQVMLLELLGEVLVVGVCGERMTLLTTISDPGRVEELRQLHGEPKNSGSKRGFAGYLQGFMGKDSALPGNNSEQLRSVENVSAGVNSQSAAASRLAGAASNSDAESDELPDNYREVVSQIKNRLQKGDRG